MSKRIHKKYPVELKLKAVNDYLSGKGTQWEICKKYEILSTKQLYNWILWYNGHREFKESSSAKGEIYMTKGRKTTLEERAEIVLLQGAAKGFSRNLSRTISSREIITI